MNIKEFLKQVREECSIKYGDLFGVRRAGDSYEIFKNKVLVAKLVNGVGTILARNTESSSPTPAKENQ